MYMYMYMYSGGRGSLCEGEGDFTVFFCWEEKDDKVVSGLSLSNGGVQRRLKTQGKIQTQWRQYTAIEAYSLIY